MVVVSVGGLFEVFEVGEVERLAVEVGEVEQLVVAEVGEVVESMRT